MKTFFTKEDMRMAYFNYDGDNMSEEGFNKMMQSLSQPNLQQYDGKEVEFVTEEFIEVISDEQKNAPMKKRPKLTSEGKLIIKLI